MLNKRPYMTKALAVAIAEVAFTVLGAFAQVTADLPQVFTPDSVFNAKSLNGWHTLGEADWRVENGEIVGVPKSPGGGWLVLDKGYQDIGFFSSFECAQGCKSGVLFRVAKTPDGMTGVLVSLSAEGVSSYNVNLDAQGQEISRTKLPPFTGGMIRYSTLVSPPTPGRTGSAAGGGGGRRANASEEDSDAPASRPGRSGTAPGPVAGAWNKLQVILDADIIRATLNPADAIGGDRGSVTGDGGKGYGAVAIYVGGTGEVRLKDVSFKDLNSKKEPIEQVSKNFSMQRISDYFYSRGAGVGDFNHDGIPDIIAGPYYYLGPDFTERKEIELATAFDPSTQYPEDNVSFAFDYTGDGWDDVVVLGQNGGRPVYLYVNPKGESRRWDKYVIIPATSMEDIFFKDIDGDGKPEILFGAENKMAYAKPDPADPTKPWVIHNISEKVNVNPHGIGAGDIAGKGRMDIVTAAGWWEHPAVDNGQPWAFHPQYFGHGADELCVYDVNGDGLNDVVTGIEAHGYGISWFEQKKDKAGNTSFVEHPIMGNLAAKNAGNVTFSEGHASACADMDGDGIPDLVVGKRPFAHLDSYTDPDPYGPGVLYVYHVVRDPKAPGGARFVPELIHNRSGVGSHVTLMDVNKDGATDIVLSNSKGTFVFFNKTKTSVKPKAKTTAE